jgi:alpha-glucosidase
VAAMLLLTVRGTPTLYYGDELGLPDTPIPPDRVQDPAELRQPGRGIGRDPVRTPMPWTGDAPNAGFTTGEPWLSLNPDWPTRNVAAQTGEAGSMLELHRALLKLRRERAALRVGALEIVEGRGDLLIYMRTLGSERLMVVLNLGGEAASPHMPVPARPLLSTLGEPLPVTDMVHVRPNEGLVLELSPA